MIVIITLQYYDKEACYDRPISFFIYFNAQYSTIAILNQCQKSLDLNAPCPFPQVCVKMKIFTNVSVFFVNSRTGMNTPLSVPNQSS
ncbi:MAG TPA: hypothetical protein DCZ44_00790 [Flavobacteriaceae bacterium]|nr:hypothetical protein [Flavobacteriaceae bacterium]